MKRELRQRIDMDTGVVTEECYYLDSNLHRQEVEGPAQIFRGAANEVLGVRYWRNGRLHRESGPARIDLSSDGLVLEEQYFHHGKKHRVDGPAVIERSPSTGCITREDYMVRGLAHRNPKEGPASRTIYLDHGRLVVDEQYYWFNQSYRDPSDGPHHIRRELQTGNTLHVEYCQPEETPPESPNKHFAQKRVRAAVPKR